MRHGRRHSQDDRRKETVQRQERAAHGKLFHAQGHPGHHQEHQGERGTEVMLIGYALETTYKLIAIMVKL